MTARPHILAPPRPTPPHAARAGARCTAHRSAGRALPSAEAEQGQPAVVDDEASREHGLQHEIQQQVVTRRPVDDDEDADEAVEADVGAVSVAPVSPDDVAGVCTSPAGDMSLG